jgi:uncharacterized paraquat-inducible protein A
VTILLVLKFALKLPRLQLRMYGYSAAVQLLHIERND